jgi:hypothetical protein
MNKVRKSDVTIEDIKAIMVDNCISLEGFDNKPASTEDIEFNLLAFDLSLDYLRNIDKIKSLNKKVSSYGLKHRVERAYNKPVYQAHVPQGIFIAAAIYSNFTPGKIISDYGLHSSCYFNMSNRSLRAAR